MSIKDLPYIVSLISIDQNNIKLRAFQYSTEGKVKEPNLAAEAGLEILSAVTAYSRGDMGGVIKSALGLVKTATGNTTKADEYTKKTRTSPADVVGGFEISELRPSFNFYQISWSGCKDSQTSADTQEAGEATGAMSYVSQHVIVIS